MSLDRWKACNDQGECPWPMISVEDALATVLRETVRLETVRVPLLDSLDAVLAEDVHATQPHPPFRASIMDGFAVVSADGPGEYPVLAESLAGSRADAQRWLQPGEVAYITTGAPVPEGADAVVPVEQTRPANETGDRVRILESARAALKPGLWIRPVGCDIARDALVLRAGTVLGPTELGLLATLGLKHVPVVRRPRVGVLSTGDEILDLLGEAEQSIDKNSEEENKNNKEPKQQESKHVDHEEQGDQKALPESGRIWDSNRPMLLALLRQSAAVGVDRAVDLGIVRDRRAELKTRLLEAAERCDAVIVSGGVSMGSADLLKPVLAEIGELHFGRMRMKPGKPTTFASVPRSSGKRCLVFALPGNPVSAQVCYRLVTEPALKKLAGHGLWGSSSSSSSSSATSSNHASHNPPRVSSDEEKLAGFVPGSDSAADHDGEPSLPSSDPLPPSAPVPEKPHGSDRACQLPSISVALAQDIELDPVRPEYHRALVFWDAGRARFWALSTGVQRSSRLLSLADCNAILRMRQASGVQPAGSFVEAMLFAELPADPSSLLQELPSIRSQGRVATAGCGHSHGPGAPPDHHAEEPGHKAEGKKQGHAHGHAHNHGHAHKHNHGPNHAHGHGDNKGHNQDHKKPQQQQVAVQEIRIAALTVSDRVAAGAMEDRSVPALDAWISGAARELFPGLRLLRRFTATVPDEPELIQAQLRSWCDLGSGKGGKDGEGEEGGEEDAPELVITMGGTGFAPRDVTPEATAAVIERPAPGIVHLCYAAGLASTPLAVLSRLTAGVRRRSLIMNLPGSPRAVAEVMGSLMAVAPHAIRLLRGEVVH